MDALVAMRLLDRGSDERYSSTLSCAVYLDPRQPKYIGSLLEYLNSRVYPMWHSLKPALLQGKAQCGPAAAGGFHDYFFDSELSRLFFNGMTGGSRLIAQSLATQFPWQNYATLIDIGTAQGCVPVEIARVHPHLTGGGFDLAVVRPEFEAYVAQQGLTDRLIFYPGDFFADPLPTADVLGRVLHDWDVPKGNCF